MQACSHPPERFKVLEMVCSFFFPSQTQLSNITTAKTTIDGVGDVAAALQGHTVVLRDELFRRFLLLQGLDILENRLNTVLTDKLGAARYAFAHDVDYINGKKRTGGTDAKPKFLGVRPTMSEDHKRQVKEKDLMDTQMITWVLQHPESAIKLNNMVGEPVSVRNARNNLFHSGPMPDEQLRVSLKAIKTTVMKVAGLNREPQALIDLETTRTTRVKPHNTIVLDDANAWRGRVRMLKPTAHPPLQGRDDTVVDVTNILNQCNTAKGLKNDTPHPTCTLVYGPMGVGKTALVTQCLHGLQAELVDHDFGWVRGNSDAAFRADLIGFGRMVVPTITNTTEESLAFDLTMGWFKNPNHKWVLLVDDLRRTVCEWLFDLFPCSNGVVICTTWETPTSPFDQFSNTMELKPLETAASVALLVSGTHKTMKETVEVTHRSAVDTFLEHHLGNLPVAVVIANRLFKKDETITDLMTRFKDLGPALSNYGDGVADPSYLRAVLGMVQLALLRLPRVNLTPEDVETAKTTLTMTALMGSTGAPLSLLRCGDIFGCSLNNSLEVAADALVQVGLVKLEDEVLVCHDRITDSILLVFGPESVQKENANTFTKARNDAFVCLKRDFIDKANSTSWSSIDFAELPKHVPRLEAMVGACIQASVDGLLMGSVFDALGRVYDASYSKPDAAIEWFKKAIEIRDANFGSDHPFTATSYNNIGLAYKSKGMYDTEIKWYLKAIAIQEAKLGSDHPTTATSYNNIGGAYKSKGEYVTAIKWYRKAMAICEAKLGSDHPSTATSYCNIGGAYESKGEYDTAIEWFLKAIAIQEAKLGRDHPSTATSYNNIGYAYGSKGEYNTAIKWYLKAMAICEAKLGSDHPSTAASYCNIGGAYESKGEYDTAIEWYRKAMAICEEKLGSDHSSTATSYNNIGGAYGSKGRYDTAIEWILKAIAIQEAKLGSDHPSTATSYCNIGGAYGSKGEYNTAIEWYRKAIAIQEATLGSDHPTTATSYNNIGVVYESKGEYVTAIKWYRKAMAICKVKLGSDHPSTATSYNNIGGAYKSKGEYVTAIGWYLKAIAILEAKLGSDHPDTVASYVHLGAVYFSNGDIAKAEDVCTWFDINQVKHHVTKVENLKQHVRKDCTPRKYR